MAKIKEEKKSKKTKADKKTASAKSQKTTAKKASPKASTKKTPKTEQKFETKSTRSKKGNVKVIFLGGVDGIGMNCTAFEYGEDIILVDCGVSFPEDDMLGVDLVIPDFTYLEDNANRVKALLITHGHEDHIGAVPYFLKKFPSVPVFATRLTLGIIEGKLSEHGIRNAKLQEVHAGTIVGLGAFECEFIHVNHSMPDACAICITTPNGRILHTGDFKVDFTPVDEKPIDLARIAELGRKGIRLWIYTLMCHSINLNR